jgi:hypothetical protein
MAAGEKDYCGMMLTTIQMPLCRSPNITRNEGNGKRNYLCTRKVANR